MSRNRIALLVAVSVGAVGLAVPAGASALTVSSDASGLQMVEPGSTRAVVKVSLVNSGGVKYRVETPNFGGPGDHDGPGVHERIDHRAWPWPSATGSSRG